MTAPAEAPFATKAEWAYARLRDMITNGELRSGQRLRLGEVARDLRISQMPVREALRMLQRDGLVEIESHRGATVAEVTWSRVYEVVLVRTHLEVLAAREALPHHDAASVRALEGLVGRMRTMVERGQPMRFSEANRRFHTLLYEPCPYPLLRHEIQELWDTMWRTRARSLFHLRSERLEGAQQEHRAIVAAVRRGDAAALVESVERHRDRTLAAWRAVADEAAARG